MINSKIIEGLNEQIGQFLNINPQATQEDIKQNMSALLQSAFSHLDLVTRDEFDAQRAVLMRTRERLEQLEAQVQSLEAKLQSSSGESAKQISE